MRNSFYFLLCLILLISCDKMESESTIKNLTEIHLNFKDYNPNEHKGFIDLKIENAINPIEQQLKISDSGTVTYSFINDKKREVIFNYENREFSLIISPSEKVKAELTIEQLVDWKSKFTGFNVVSGTNRGTNNLILANTSYLDSLIKQAPDGFSRDDGLIDIEYKNKRISDMQKQLESLDSFLLRKNISDQTFIDWSKAQIRYKAGYDLSIYPFFGTPNPKIDFENPYFRFINEVSSKDSDQLNYQAYFKYLEMLATSIVIMSNISDKYSNQREILKKDSPTNFPITFNLIKKRQKKHEDELLMAYAYRRNKEVSKKYQDSLKKFVNDKLWSQIKPKETSGTSGIISLIENYDIPRSEKTELLKLYDDTKGKVVFHNFWFTNCAPCMEELPHYNDLISKTDDKDVEFIFYGAYMEKEEWMRTRDKFKLKGKHHLLTKYQLAFFERYFGVHGFPHHQLLKSNGKIGEKLPLGVYPKHFDDIIKLIKKHQVEKNNGA
ncbi:Thiol-disulfide isomerase or thioredoxin [Salegentibacter echinorum]|uniref:Thiol-disulfide isomerase or thioredoxin n=1 Tax=Salegentibacter echinorum TaxID=1073325 RepID=A0A1M5L478_SALEC|nr:TlpA disulfide reductase family protein [Salegentibacter echinorum]SHG59801.1 Thiol-disulfide isomerase or thioredoxin [Salegentibacter echinorum]